MRDDPTDPAFDIDAWLDAHDDAPVREELEPDLMKDPDDI